MAQSIFIGGKWLKSHSSATFRAENPAAARPLLGDEYPISDWHDCDAALDAATAAFSKLRTMPPENVARFLDVYAELIESRAADLVAIAHTETALPVAPRLKDVELPRTTSQLRQAAAAAREGSWALPTIDTKAEHPLALAPLGPVWVFGPNNFPFAFNSIAGGDFAAAIAAGNPVIAKANTSHPGTTRLLAEAGAASGRENRLAAGHGAIDLSHQPCRRRAAGRRSAHRRDRLHRQPLGRPGAEGRRRRRRQTDLFGTFEHQSRRHSAGRT